MATATNTTPGQIMMLGDLAGTGDSPQLVATGVTPGTYTPTSTYSSGNVNINGQAFVIDAKGRIVFANNVATAYAVPIASSTHKGFVQADGTTITSASGIISAHFPTATTSVLGLVKPDGTSVTVSSGTISVPTATTSVLGLVKPDGTTIGISGGIISQNIPTATSSLLGLVKIGSGISISSGVISVATATSSTLGIARPDGLNLYLNGSGKIARQPLTVIAGLFPLVTNTTTNAPFGTVNASAYNTWVCTNSGSIPFTGFTNTGGGGPLGVGNNPVFVISGSYPTIGTVYVHQVGSFPTGSGSMFFETIALQVPGYAGTTCLVFNPHTF